MRSRRTLAAVVAAGLWCACVYDAHAQQVFANDPLDPGTSRPYPIMPGLPLLLPGPDGEFGTPDDVTDNSIVGDIDLVARVGDVPAGAIPPPASAPGGPVLVTSVAGGGASGHGAETIFTVHVSSGSGSPYGATLTDPELDGRPVTVYAFADLDGDGVIGPTNADGSADNVFERQEAYSYAGRQVGQLAAGRVLGSVGLHLAAPASIGGLKVALVAGAYTGSDPDLLYSDGTPIYTLWPFFPPLDPERVLEGMNSPAPDPTLPSELKFDIERNYLPTPAHPTLGTPFAVPVDGSERTTDQFVSVSGPSRATRFFVEPLPATFRPTSRTWLRRAPAVSGPQQVLVIPVADVALAADGSAPAQQLRLLPVDLLGNVSDPPPGGMTVTLSAVGSVRIVAPDIDADETKESLTLQGAAGVVVTLDDAGEVGVARVDVTADARLLDSLAVQIATAAVDQDADAAYDDGNASGVTGDAPCDENDIGSLACDDNCVLTINPDQADSNLDGLGDCCDGRCVTDPDDPRCDECQFVGAPSVPGTLALSNTRWRLRIGKPGKPDKLRLRAKLSHNGSATIAPDNELFTVSFLRAGEVVFGVALDSAFTQVSARPKYRYKDLTASVGGLRKSVVSRASPDFYRLALNAIAAGLAPPEPGSWQIAVTSGDDSFVGTTACLPKRSGISCAQ